MENNTYIKRKAYFTSREFANHLATLMIPDVYQFVINIFNCLALAHDSKLICNDIASQLLDLRKKNKVFYNSFTYKVGNLLLDGRAYANRNMREWCSNIHKTRDSLLQIINIVYDLNVDINDVYERILDKINDDELKRLWLEYKNTLSIEFKLNNNSKHILNIGSYEKFSPIVLSKIDYFVKNNGDEIHFDELMGDDKENEINEKIINLLEYLINKAKNMTYSNRKYIELSYDPETPFSTGTELVNELDPNKINTCELDISTKENYDGTLTCTNVVMRSNKEQVPNIIYLASLYKFRLNDGNYMNKINEFDSEYITVINGENEIGKYVQKKRNNSIGTYFSKYEFEQK